MQYHKGNIRDAVNSIIIRNVNACTKNKRTNRQTSSPFHWSCGARSGSPQISMAGLVRFTCRRILLQNSAQHILDKALPAHLAFFPLLALHNSSASHSQLHRIQPKRNEQKLYQRSRKRRSQQQTYPTTQNVWSHCSWLTGEQFKCGRHFSATGSSTIQVHNCDIYIIAT